MIEIKRIYDAELIRKAICHPRIYKWVSDDGSPLVGDYQPTIMDSIFYLGCYKDGEYCGLFMIVPHAFAWHDFHTCLLPSIWGNSIECAKLAVDWMFSNTECRRLTTIVPENNKLALNLAKSVGAIEYGFNPNCWMKNGVLFGVHMLGISKD